MLNSQLVVPNSTAWSCGDAMAETIVEARNVERLCKTGGFKSRPEDHFQQTWAIFKNSRVTYSLDWASWKCASSTQKSSECVIPMVCQEDLPGHYLITHNNAAVRAEAP